MLMAGKCDLIEDDGKSSSDYWMRNHVLSIIMPAYNEGRNIRKNITETCVTFKEMGIPFEIIVVNDGSDDDTEVEIGMACDENPEVMLVTYKDNGGKGNALKAGFKHSRGDIVTFVDADLELHPKQLKRFFEEMSRFNADIVIGSKRHPESIINYPAKRRMLSKGYNLLVRALLGVKLTDTQPGLKLFRRIVLEREFPKVLVKRWAFDLELLVNSSKDGFKIVEAPLELHYLRENGGRLGLSDVFHIFQDTLGIFHRTHITGYYLDIMNQPIPRDSIASEDQKPLITGK